MQYCGNTNPFATDRTQLCGLIFELADNITGHVVQKKHFFNIYLIENIEEMFFRY